MLEPDTASSGNLFKSLSLIALILLAWVAHALAHRSHRARRLSAWLASHRHRERLRLWLAVGIMFVVFGGFTLVHEWRN